MVLIIIIIIFLFYTGRGIPTKRTRHYTKNWPVHAGRYFKYLTYHQTCKSIPCTDTDIVQLVIWNTRSSKSTNIYLSTDPFEKYL